MWDDASTWVLGILGIAASTNLLAKRSTRRVQTLRSRADLAAVLPPGDGKDRIAKYVDRQAVLLAAHFERAEAHWVERAAPRFEQAWGWGAAVAVVAYVVLLGADGAVEAVATVGFVLAVLTMVVGMLGFAAAHLTRLPAAIRRARGT